MGEEMPIKPPITEPITMGSITALGSWLVASFGPTETILIVIAGIMLGVVMGWMPSPMMKTMQDIREEQIKHQGIQLLTESREAEAVHLHELMMGELRIICVHDSTTDAQKAECWK